MKPYAVLLFSALLLIAACDDGCKTEIGWECTVSEFEAQAATAEPDEGETVIHVRFITPVGDEFTASHYRRIARVLRQNESKPFYINMIECEVKELSIPAFAFAECINLTDVTLPRKVNRIETGAFKNCIALANSAEGVNLTVEAGAYEGCTWMGTAEIYGDAASVESGAFAGCHWLENFYPKESELQQGERYYGVRNYGYGSDALIEIDTNGNKILHSFPSAYDTATVPAGVTIIGDFAFADCFLYLTGITIGPQVTEIKNSAFKNCVLIDKITIPSSVIKMGAYAFEGWTSRQKIEVPFAKNAEPTGWHQDWDSGSNAEIIYTP